MKDKLEEKIIESLDSLEKTSASENEKIAAELAEIDNFVELPAIAAEYQGKKVTLNKPFRTPDGPKKFGVYVQNDKGNVVLVRFGDPNLSIKRDDPKRRKAYFDRHGRDRGPKWKAKYWSHWAWTPGNTLP